MELKPQTVLQGGRYVIQGVLGRGGFGVTYLAEQVMAKRKVCIKEFFPKDYYTRGDDTRSLTLASQGFAESMNRYKEKFVKEAQTIAALDHANIIPIYDVFEENNTAYYVMEYIDGESLSEVVKRRGALVESEAVEYVRQAASALEYLHERKIMHLDIKPGNIMLRRKDNRVVLIDFGLSKHYDEQSGEATSTTPVGVSHGYAPLEQYKQGGVNTFSPETDIYSLGATLYYMVTGKVPPEAATLISEPLEFPQHVSTTLRSAITAAMALSPKQRPASVGKFVAMLSGIGVSENTIIIDKSVKTVDEKPVDEKPAPKQHIEEKPKHQTPNEDKPKPKISLRWVFLAIAVFVIGLVVFISVNDGKSKDVITTSPYAVGDYYNENGIEGIVFEVWDGGRHGKIVSLDETKVTWDSRVKYEYGQYKNGTKTYADSESDGKANTNKLMSRSDSQYFLAAKWCRDKGASWYLPALNEWEAIYNNRDKIDNSLTEVGATTLKDDWYWSSTEGDEDSAYGVHMDDGYTGTSHKIYNFYVRAVSAF